MGLLDIISLSWNIVFKRSITGIAAFSRILCHSPSIFLPRATSLKVPLTDSKWSSWIIFSHLCTQHCLQQAEFLRVTGPAFCSVCKWLWLLSMRLCLFKLRAGGRRSLWGFLLLIAFHESHIEGTLNDIFLTPFMKSICSGTFYMHVIAQILLSSLQWVVTLFSKDSVSHSHCLLSSLTVHPNPWLHWRICTQLPLASVKYVLSYWTLILSFFLSPYLWYGIFALLLLFFFLVVFKYKFLGLVRSCTLQKVFDCHIVGQVEFY